MGDTTTRISDLPENITTHIQQPNYNMQMMQQQPPPQFQGNMGQQQYLGQQQYSGQGGDSMGQNTYVPINIHPNPYGIAQQQPNGMPLPQGSPPRGQGQGQAPAQEQYDPTGGIGQQRLPSRDIPMNQTDYHQDEEVQANYIPRAKLTSEYIRDYEMANEERLKHHEKNKHREEMVGDLFSDLQAPILVAVLYFIFQMPIVNTILRKYFSFLNIYHEDGNINFIGMLLKSSLFGSLFYSMQLAAYKLSNL